MNRNNDSRIVLTLHADMSAKDAHEFMQLIRTFDAKHSDCRFEILAQAAGLSVDQCMALLSVDPELTFFQIRKNGPVSKT